MMKGSVLVAYSVVDNLAAGPLNVVATSAMGIRKCYSIEARILTKR